MNDVLEFPDRHAFRVWLDPHGTESGGVWLFFGKRNGPVTLSAHEALEEALCFGWIDGQMRSIDSRGYTKYFARRTPKSAWSDKNKKLAQSLIDRGLMAQAGLNAIAEAKKRGAWDTSARAAVDEEHLKAFISIIQQYEPAHSNLLSMPLSVQKTYTGFYYEAKQATTRQTRLERIIDRLNRNLKPM